MSPRIRKLHEHLPHTFEEVIEVIARGKPQEIKKIKPTKKYGKKKGS